MRTIAAAARARPAHAGEWPEWVDEQVERAIEPLRDACEAALRVREVSRDLKVIARGDEHLLGPVDVRKVMESSLRMAQNEIRHRAKLVREYSEVPPVHANETRLGQVFLNLVVCDVLMPDFTGIELFERLSEQDPDQAARMVFMTGGAFTPEARAFIERVPERVIEKPFDVPRLRALVDEVLR